MSDQEAVHRADGALERRHRHLRAAGATPLPTCPPLSLRCRRFSLRKWRRRSGRRRRRARRSLMRWPSCACPSGAARRTSVESRHETTLVAFGNAAAYSPSDRRQLASDFARSVRSTARRPGAGPRRCDHFPARAGASPQSLFERACEGVSVERRWCEQLCVSVCATQSAILSHRLGGGPGERAGRCHCGYL